MTSSPVRRRHSPAVYRRRRLVVLLGALVVIGSVVWLLVAQPWAVSASVDADAQEDGEQSTLPVPASQATPGGTGVTGTGAATGAAGTVEGAVPEGQAASPGAAPAAKPCASGDIAVQAVTDQDTYQPGQNPQFFITLTNNGSDCTLNVGTTTQSFTVMSGDDVWWRSTDCQSEPSDMTVLLGAGQTVSSAAPVTWDRSRSSVDTCADQTRPLAPGGGASYHLSVEIGGIPSAQSQQFLLY